MTDPTRRLLGGMLMAVGGLIAALSGLCTGWFQVMFLVDWWNLPPPGANSHRLIFPLWLPPLFGVLPILAGAGLFLWGRGLRRAARVQRSVHRPGPDTSLPA